jgi:hypothetical protein
MRKALSLVAVVTLTAGLLAGCGSKSTTSSATTAAAGSGTCPSTETISFAKTKFAAHAGLAAGAFYRYVFEPLRAGAFSSGASGRIASLAKAGLAVAFVVHELRVAESDAKGDPTLCKLLVAPLQSLSGAFGGIVDKVKGGTASAADVAPVDQQFSSLKQQASSTGTAIQNQLPSAEQLLLPSLTGG